MLNDFLPQHADNTYHGHSLALWIFAIVVFTRIVMSLNSLLNARTTATHADGIPLHSYTPAAEQTVVSLFSLLGLHSFIICLMCILVLIRYRNLVPVMFVLLLLQSLGGRLIPHFLPIIRTGTPPGIFVHWVLLALIAVGLVLSVRW
jgi:ABC-type transport system involved in multi-copper enzyme maturation permease subunit